MDKIFFTSDHHFYHKKVLEYSKRPFKFIDHMNEIMIEKWNEVVNFDSTVYYLGDLSLGDKRKTKNVLERLNGKIHLIWGNHDRSAMQNKWRFESITGLLNISIDDDDIKKGYQQIILCHTSFQVWMGIHKGSWNLYGHSHGSLPERKGFKSCDIGVDCWDYYPVSYKQLKKKFSGDFYKNYIPIDHHGL